MKRQTARNPAQFDPWLYRRHILVRLESASGAHIKAPVPSRDSRFTLAKRITSRIALLLVYAKAEAGVRAVTFVARA